MSFAALREERIQQLKAQIQQHNQGFSPSLQHAFGYVDTYMSTPDLLFPVVDDHDACEAADDRLAPVIRATSGTLKPRKPRRLLHDTSATRSSQPIGASQVSQMDNGDDMDVDGILEEIQDVLVRVNRLGATPEMSQSSQHDGPGVFQDLLALTPEQLQIACEHVQLTWTDALLADLCAAIGRDDNANPASVRLAYQSFLYPYMSKTTSNLPRVLLNDLVLVSKRFDSIAVDCLIMPLLNDALQEHHELRHSDIVVKLIQEALGQTTRLVLLRYLLFGSLDKLPLAQWNGTAFSKSALQLVNTVCTATPLVALETPVLQQILLTCRSVILQEPRNKEAMQVMLALTSKHGPTLVAAGDNLLADMEAIAQSSQMFLKRNILNQLTALKKKRPP
ncbi:hypothetical protein BC940DRAFT_290858 [Gongronella butleri]|nr:hypothetical protein BC940DRAFT_290858 [Gongronella butleri]